jgi:hypothetical protein
VVGMVRCAVPGRVVAVGMNIRAVLAFEEVAPLHAARTSQRDVPTKLSRYRREGERSSQLNCSGTAHAADCDQSRMAVLAAKVVGLR